MYIHMYILLLEVVAMDTIKTAKIFRNGNSRAVRIPKEFCVGSDELLIHKIGNALILLPAADPLALFKESFSAFSDDFFAEGRNQPKNQTRETLFSAE